jgi:AAA+ ATPase superfamily predicted ATPase
VSGFVGRGRELAVLRGFLDQVAAGGADERGRAVLLRGRRRVGKSRLVEVFAEQADAPLLWFTASKGAAADRQREAFLADLVASTLPRAADLADVRAGSWQAALRLVAQAVDPAVPSIVVLDELPWLLESDPAVEGDLQAVWDRTLAKLPVLLLALGSDLAVMERLNSYGRTFYERAREMTVGPLSPADVADALRLEPADALDAYLVTGGFPLALREWQPGQSLWAYLRRALAEPTSALIVTGERSLAAEFPTELQAREVLRVIGSGERTFTTIGQKAGNLRAGSLNRSLEALQAKRVVAADNPLSTAPSRETRYRVADPALRFWLRFIDPGLPLIERGRGDLVLAAVRRDFGTWRGRAIEPVVRESLLRLLHDDADFADATAVAGYWTRSNDVEVDLIGADRAPVANQIAFVGSIKWLERAPFDQADVARLLQHRARVPGATDHTPLAAVTRSGSAADLLTRVWGPADLVDAWRHRPQTPTPAPET